VGLIAVLIIYLIKWSNGDELIPEDSLSVLSILWLLFFSNNLLAYFGGTSLANFLAIVKRLSQVF